MFILVSYLSYFVYLLVYYFAVVIWLGLTDESDDSQLRIPINAAPLTKIANSRPILDLGAKLDGNSHLTTCKIIQNINSLCKTFSPFLFSFISLFQRLVRILEINLWFVQALLSLKNSHYSQINFHIIQSYFPSCNFGYTPWLRPHPGFGLGTPSGDPVYIFGCMPAASSGTTFSLSGENFYL